MKLDESMDVKLLECSRNASGLLGRLHRGMASGGRQWLSLSELWNPTGVGVVLRCERQPHTMGLESRGQHPLNASRLLDGPKPYHSEGS